MNDTLTAHWRVRGGDLETRMTSFGKPITALLPVFWQRLHQTVMNSTLKQLT